MTKQFGPTVVHPENPLYSVDTGQGYWLDEGGGAMITLNKKFATDETIRDAILDGTMNILVYAITDRVINAEGKKGGRITFTLPKELFCKRASEREIDRSIEDRPGLPEHLTQRAPGKNLFLTLDESLSMEKKILAVKRLSDKPILISPVFNAQPDTRRLCFRVMAPTEWLISQKLD